MVDWDEFEEGEVIGWEWDPRKVFPVFFLIDISESMIGEKMDTVNRIMQEIMHDLHDLESPDFDDYYAVLSFGAKCKWETGEEGFIPVDGIWKELSACNGKADFDTACRMLNEKLSGRHGFFKFASGRTIIEPVIILLTDGAMNEKYKTGIEELKQNKYFKYSCKIAIIVGDAADQQLCINFTGDKETAWPTYNRKAFMKILDSIGRLNN